MAVKEMSEHECLSCLSNEHYGHLACVKDGRPYVVPINYAYGLEKLYLFSLPGQKIDWLRENPNACIQVAEMRDDQCWRSSCEGCTMSCRTSTDTGQNASMRGTCCRNDGYGGSREHSSPKHLPKLTRRLSFSASRSMTLRADSSSDPQN